MSQKNDPVLYQGTAWYYSRFRPAYPAALVTVLRDKFGLDGTGRLLDLGCGPGPVAIRLAYLFEHVVAMDPQPEMLAEGRASAERAGVSNIEWIAGGSEVLARALGTFRLVTMGNSFHWMDRARTLDALYDLVIDGGGLAVVGHSAPIPAPPPTAWRVAINRVIKDYLGDRRLPWDSGPPPAERDEEYIARSRFKD
ncbi:MAG: class I SAM-dependent methyltransferase, partial [Candidatus Binataceae bacterium]